MKWEKCFSLPLVSPSVNKVLAAPAWRDSPSQVPEAQEHCSVFGLRFWERIHQDLHGASAWRCVCTREKDGSHNCTAVWTMFSRCCCCLENLQSSETRYDGQIVLRSMLVTSRLLGGLSNCLVIFPFHDRFWTLLLSFLQEACLPCCDLSGARWRRPP